MCLESFVNFGRIFLMEILLHHQLNYFAIIRYNLETNVPLFDKIILLRRWTIWELTIVVEKITRNKFWFLLNFTNSNYYFKFFFFKLVTKSFLVYEFSLKLGKCSFITSQVHYSDSKTMKYSNIPSCKSFSFNKVSWTNLTQTTT